MFDLDDLSWNASPARQVGAIEWFGQDGHDLSRFLQPNGRKDVWDNCAVILTRAKPDHIAPHLLAMAAWLQDPNWPGADRIADHLRRLPDGVKTPLITEARRRARACDDRQWLDGLDRLL